MIYAIAAGVLFIRFYVSMKSFEEHGHGKDGFISGRGKHESR